MQFVQELHGAMTAGKTESQELSGVAQRLASFAAGCLGTSTPAHTGSRLGIMGNVSEAELKEVLHHIEVLSKQRASAAAGRPVQGNQPALTSFGYPATSNSSFQQAFKEACGVDADHIHLHLPRDARGQVDLLRIFSLEDGKGTHLESCEALAEFVDDPSELPFCDEPSLVEREADEAHWLQDAIAINGLRSAVFHNVTLVEAPDLQALSRRCRSRRPALCKTALRAMAELAKKGVQCDWISAAAEVVAACLAAMQLTKVTAKMGEETLDAVCGRLREDASVTVTLHVLTSLNCPELKHPTCVAALLRVSSTSLSSLGETEALTAQAAEEISGFCEEVLKNRRLSPAFSEARALQRQVAKVQNVP